MVAGIALVWLNGRLKSRKLKFTPAGLDLPILIFLGVSCLSLTQAANLHAGLDRLVALVTGAGIYFLVRHGLPEWRDVRAVVRALILSSVLVALYGIVQITLDLDPPPGLFSIGSTFGNPNHMAEFLMMSIPLTLAAFLWVRGRRAAFPLAALVVEIAAVFIARGRGAMVGLIAGLALFGVLLLLYGGKDPGRSRLGTALAALLIILTVGALAGKYRETRMGLTLSSHATNLHRPRGEQIPGKAETVALRLHWYRDTLRMALDHPLLGIGIGQFRYVYPEYRGYSEDVMAADQQLEHAHNDFLESAAATGFPGAAILLWLLVMAGVRGIRGVRDASGFPERCLRIGGVAAVAAYWVNNLFSYGFYSPVSFALFWFLLGMSEFREEGAVRFRPREVRLPGIVTAGGVRVALLLPLFLGAFWVTAKPVVADFYISRAYDRLGGGDLVQAAHSYERALRWNPHYSYGYGLLSDVLEMLGRPRRAEEMLEKVVRQEPYSYAEYFFLGEAWEQIGNRDRAMEAFQKAVSIYPFYARAYYRIGLLQENAGDLADALASYRRSYRSRTGFVPALNSAAVLLARQGKMAEALGLWEKARGFNPLDYVVRYDLGKAYLARGLPGKAAQEFRVALVLQPGDPRIEEILREAEVRSGSSGSVPLDLQNPSPLPRFPER